MNGTEKTPLEMSINLLLSKYSKKVIQKLLSTNFSVDVAY